MSQVLSFLNDFANLSTDKNTFTNFLFVQTDKPGPPESFRPTEITENSVTLKWAEPNNTGGCDITGYHLERRESGRKWQKVFQRYLSSNQIYLVLHVRSFYLLIC